ncbi:hypothetical protein K501DRAFT_329795, partial [Backusella circina FSU 941]
METLHSKLLTLCSLWTSLEVDECSVNKKLSSVIQEVEKLICNERSEKRLLSACIEDAMANIEYASRIMGLSLENLLSSSIAKSMITPEILSIYGDVDPTYPKEKALTELDSKLTEEVSVRRIRIREWLEEIDRLCKELEISYPFKAAEEYHDNLSWATIQSVSCTLRDLKKTQKSKVQEFELLTRWIHYYWLALGHDAKKEDSVELSLSALFESIPFQVDLMSSTPLLLFDESYYRHESNQLTLSQYTLDVLKSKQLEFQSLYQSRLPIYKKSVSKINHVWEKLNIPLLKRQSLPTTLSQSDMEQLKTIVKSLDPLLQEERLKYIKQVKEKLVPLWDGCLLSTIEREEFIQSLHQIESKSELVSVVTNHVAFLKSLQVDGKALSSLINERKDLIQKMIDFEKTASDPKRLFQASFQLIEEEKWRNSCLPRLLHLDRALIKALQEFEKLAGKPVMIGNRRYLDTLYDEIADREANQTFFGFLNSEPVAAKRVKSRPASIGSVGALVTTTKKPQLKTRAASAIFNLPQNNNNSINNKSIQKPTPSKSMPLSKKPQTRSPLSNSPSTSEEDVYSSKAYINSNITLTKAFRKKSRMRETASMIPIPISPRPTSTPQ